MRELSLKQRHLLSQAAEQEFDKEYMEGDDKFAFLGMTMSLADSLPAPGERRASSSPSSSSSSLFSLQVLEGP